MCVLVVLSRVRKCACNLNNDDRKPRSVNARPSQVHPPESGPCPNHRKNQKNHGYREGVHQRGVEERRRSQRIQDRRCTDPERCKCVRAIRIRHIHRNSTDSETCRWSHHQIHRRRSCFRRIQHGRIDRVSNLDVSRRVGSPDTPQLVGVHNELRCQHYHQQPHTRPPKADRRVHREPPPKPPGSHNPCRGRQYLPNHPTASWGVLNQPRLREIVGTNNFSPFEGMPALRTRAAQIARGVLAVVP